MIYLGNERNDIAIEIADFHSVPRAWWQLTHLLPSSTNSAEISQLLVRKLPATSQLPTDSGYLDLVESGAARQIGEQLVEKVL